MKRTALAVVGAAALATLTIGGAALAAGDDSARDRPGAVSVTDSPSPDNTPSPADTPTSPASPDDSSTTTAPAQPGGAVVPGDLAAAAALAHVGGGTVTSVESEVEHGRAVWKVRVVKDGVRYDLHVDKVTGAITRFENKGSEDRRGGDRDDRGGNSGKGSDNSGSGKSGRGSDD